MSRVDEFLRRFPDYPATKSQIDYARYLEQQGLTFLVDFGFENAEDITWANTDLTPQ